ncbi:hypothetical protein DSAG12_03482 [Promethearchaeum syntrophicum]|uniref:Uncharacterized protein n=1 Tax=Promethearchaeum syntrophicum TaxID=2594042 RepID=A0A5B9DF20_9ARCH|nr:hypothetical protein [Candidatus Prometheoarchaeum syntrophicum]QEE17645.1 hypothetical protein DSAG12_03482 [Candidatus Prometheoarchaeum syntrophicum]
MLEEIKEDEAAKDLKKDRTHPRSEMKVWDLIKDKVRIPDLIFLDTLIYEDEQDIKKNFNNSN